MKIKDVKKFRQGIDFTGLATDYNFNFSESGKMMPSDIDSYIQIRETDRLKDLNFKRGHLFIEYKCSDRKVEERGLPVGQKNTFKPIADNCFFAGDLAIYAIAYHKNYDPSTLIEADKAVVKQIYIPGIMEDFKTFYKGRTVKELQEYFYEILGAKKTDDPVIKDIIYNLQEERKSLIRDSLETAYVR